MPDTALGGLTNFTRYFFPHVGKEGVIYGPKAMIVNEQAGSGGDAMPWYFRRAGKGPFAGVLSPAERWEIYDAFAVGASDTGGFDHRG